MGLYRPRVSQGPDLTLHGRWIPVPPEHGNHVLLPELRAAVNRFQNLPLALVEPVVLGRFNSIFRPLDLRSRLSHDHPLREMIALPPLAMMSCAPHSNPHSLVMSAVALSRKSLMGRLTGLLTLLGLCTGRSPFYELNRDVIWPLVRVHSGTPKRMLQDRCAISSFVFAPSLCLRQ